MTLITDGFGTRWVEPTPKKRRKKPRALRFADLSPDTILIHRSKSKSVRSPKHDLPVANDDELVIERSHVGFAIVEHRWFDPCAGQTDPTAGEMVAVRPITSHGRGGSMWPHTLRGLAMQGYDYATPEQAGLVRAWMLQREAIVAAFDAGEITIEEARVRAKPFATLLRECGIENEAPAWMA